MLLFFFYHVKSFCNGIQKAEEEWEVAENLCLEGSCSTLSGVLGVFCHQAQVHCTLESRLSIMVGHVFGVGLINLI